METQTEQSSEMQETVKNECQILMDKLHDIRMNLAPLRFLFLNYGSTGSCSTDNDDLQCLGGVLDEQLKKLQDVLNRVDMLSMRTGKRLH